MARWIVAALVATMTGIVIAKPFPGCSGGTLVGCPGTQNCSQHWITQNIDHFNWENPLPKHKSTFRQRYFVYDAFWSQPKTGPKGPVFFYFGNEDNVELYVNHTGLMWESAQEFGALLVFAEHRYYGKSMPFKDGTDGCMNWLTSEQAMADFAYLIDSIRQNMGADQSPFIGFGGSYGGMLGAWFRVHYPNAIDGVIAASAPIWSFSGLNPAYDYNAFDKGVTFDASYQGGSIDACKDNLKNVWPQIIAAAQDPNKRADLQAAFMTCDPVEENDGQAIVDWASAPWGTLAMGNYPFESSYLMHGLATLPAWPVRTACSILGNPDDMFVAVRQAVSIYYNVSLDVSCYNLSSVQQRAGPEHRRFMTSAVGGPLTSEHTRGGDSCEGSWGYQWCTEMVQPFTSGTADDMFYCPPNVNCSDWDLKSQAQACMDEWGVSPRPEWARVVLGGKRIQDATNIVFSNGGQDPWHGGGVLKSLSDSVVAVNIPNGAHHIDLMFTDPGDAQYADILAARNLERTHMQAWVKEASERYAKAAH